MLSNFAKNFLVRYCAKCGNKIAFLSGRTVYCSQLCARQAGWRRQKAKRKRST